MAGLDAQTRDEAAARPSLLACTECRRKHLKCDANVPICTRCATAGIQCNYTPSRRGYRGTKRRGTFGDNEQASSVAEFVPTYEGHVASITTLSGNSLHIVSPATPSLTGSSINDSSGNDHGDAYGSPPAVSPMSLRTNGSNPSQLLSACHQSGSGGLIDEDELVNLYYANFHAAHPILVPRSLYAVQPYPDYLKRVVLFIGSHYSPSVSSDSLRTKIVLTGQNADKSSCMAQARLLYAIALHARNEAMEAAAMMEQAVSLAIELGMNLREFAAARGMGNAVVEESLRRTWWETYCMDGYMAALHKQPGFRSNVVRSDVLLPCEEAVYTGTNRIPCPLSLEQFDASLFADEEIHFSSFTYRIEASRILARVLSVAETQHEDQVHLVDSQLAGWIHHLPPDKADVVNSHNLIDEMLFQAHMIIQCATIYLHLPRSDLLNTLPLTANIVCAERGRHMSPAATQHMHSVKATNASKELSNLASIRVPVQKHTPFFVCGLVLSAIVQLSACTIHAGSEQHRGRITLIIGLLKSMSRTWAISGQVLQQVKKVAAEVLLHTGAKPAFGNQQHQNGSDHDSVLGNQPVNWDNPWFGMLGMFENQEFHGIMHLEPVYPG